MSDSMLTPIMEVGKTNDGHIKWLYQCLCGRTVEVSRSRVSNGYTKSCGCINKGNLKHGYKNTGTYSSWASAKDRATNPKSKDFHRYGGRGIGMSERWMVFENFLFDMGDRPDGKTLDRINPMKGYELGNCRWATPKEQALNRMDVVFVTTENGLVPLVEYAKKIGITKGAAHMRFKRKTLEGVIYG